MATAFDLLDALHNNKVAAEFDAEEKVLVTVADIAGLEGKALVTAFNETKAIISAQTSVVTGIKGKVGTMVKNNGNSLTLYSDAAGPHGFRFVPGDPGFTSKAIETALVKR